MIQTESNADEHRRQDPSIRQIALLLNALPERTHRVLLGQLTGESKNRVADELSSLGEIDPLEQHRVLNRMRDALQSETSTVESVESEIQDEIQIGKARVSKKRSGSVYHTGESSGDNANRRQDGAAAPRIQLAEPEQPLHDGPSESPQDEAPVTVPYATQTDVVTGQAAVTPPPEMLQSMFAQFRQTQAAGVLPSMPAPDSQWCNNVAMPGGPTESTSNRDSDYNSVSNANTGEAETEGGFPFNSQELAERVDRFLCDLPPKHLCHALGMVTTKEAFLVLCGLPNEIAETALRMLPRRKARKVRSDMRKMGRLQLSEIDAAKTSVAQIALKLFTNQKSLAA